MLKLHMNDQNKTQPSKSEDLTGFVKQFTNGQRPIQQPEGPEGLWGGGFIGRRVGRGAIDKRKDSF